MKTKIQPNVGAFERNLSTVLGGGLVLYGLGQRTWSGLACAALGGAIAARGASGYCPLYASLGVNSLDGIHAVKLEKSIVVYAPIESVYHMWRDPQWIDGLPLQRTVEWDGEIINDIPNQLIAWRSSGDSMVRHAGSVRFRELPFERGVEIKVELSYQAPAGVIGNALARLLAHPELQISEVLKCFKQLIEAGEVATTCGQPVGAAR